MQSVIDIGIIGAGAAGLAAGIFAAETRGDLTIALLDGARTIGAKILVSGGGRCNVTNARVHPSDFHAPKSIVSRILRRFDEQATTHWFDSLGVKLKQEPTGKLFPTTDKARTVLTALLTRCQELGVHILANHRVQSITKVDDGFLLKFEHGQLTARRVIMATGGKSLPKSGSDGLGWALTEQLGHSCTTPYPALVPLLLDNGFIHKGLSGISQEVNLTTRINRKVVDRRTGSLLWTHFGISGPVVLDASRFWVIAKGQENDVTLSMSCFPDLTMEEVDRWLAEASRQPGRKTVATLLSQRLPSRMVDALCSLADQEIGENPSQTLVATFLNQLSYARRKCLTHLLTNLLLPVTGNRGWNFAEVTAGGIPLSEINPQNMLSRTVPGLYLIGEMLDCDGRIGGFNFQWAWSTGHIAGRSASMSVVD